MKKILIFCEGVTDQLFLADCLEVFYRNIQIEMAREPKKIGKASVLTVKGGNQTIEIEVKNVGGCDKLTAPIHLEQMKDNTENGRINAVIFDADALGQGNNGFQPCCQKLDDIKRTKGVTFDYYLWPDNTHDGEIENLLETLLSEAYREVYGCINEHQNCLNNLVNSNNLDIRQVTLKEKIRYYLHTLNTDSSPSKRSYKTDCWNLDANKSSKLKRLKQFLDKLIL